MNKFYNVIIITSCILIAACTPRETRLEKLQPTSGDLSIYQGEYKATPLYFTDNMGLIGYSNIWEFFRGYGKYIGDITNCPESSNAIIKIETTQDNTALLISEIRNSCTPYKKEFTMGQNITLLPTGKLVLIVTSEGPHTMTPADNPTHATSLIIDQNNNLNAIQLGDKGIKNKSSEAILSETLTIYERLN
ncbi:hypothetical protein MNBD_GAMMA26-1668 [hydrothermal vent metagenome]|uniref:Lipoprotein n=1 Tax=hydrothermal vent metagenome TaxID=652676 RepID=A0A3B1BC70_9ZZZZ